MRQWGRMSTDDLAPTVGPGDQGAQAPAGAPTEPPTEALLPRPGPGPLSLAAWILFFGAHLMLAVLPFLGALGGEPGGQLQPGMLDDPRMVAAAILGSWVTFLVALVLVWRARLGARDVGWAGLPPRSLLAWTAGTLAALLVAWVAASLLFGEHLKIVEALTRRPEGLAHWLLWLGLALTAGFTEEFVMRGYGMGLLMRLGANRWVTAVGMSVLFGILHVYQGPHAVPLLALWGFLFAVPFVVTGSLWPGILAHALVDAVAPLFIGK